MTIKLWDWDAKWALKQTFEGHTHYVMQIVINPKDNNTFASASLDRTVKVKYIYIYIYIQWAKKLSIQPLKFFRLFCFIAQKTT